MQFEGREKGRQEKEREILYRGIMTDTNARFNQKTSFNFALTNINVYFSFVKSYYFKCYHKNQMVINLCTRGSVKGSYKRIKTISTNSKTSWRIKTQGFNSELYFTIKTQTNNINNNKTLFIKIVLIPFQTLFWPWDQTKTRKKEVFSFSYTTGLQAQEWPRYCLGTETHKGFFNPLWVSAGKQAYKNHTRPIIAQKENHWNRDTWYSFPPDGLEFGMVENATVWTGQKVYYMHLYARPANFFTKQKRLSFNWVRLKKTPT